MIYEVINPSDPYTLVAERFEVACAACLFLGEGFYGLHPQNEDGEAMPPFVLGGSMEWFKERFGLELDVFVRGNLADVADCLDTLLIGGFADRTAFEDGLALITEEVSRQAWRERWLDQRRTSLNNIGRRGESLTQAFRKRLAKVG